MNPQSKVEVAPDVASIGSALRSIRKQRGFTLRDVERESSGRWKAVVVGSYERGDRALTLNKALGLAVFYEVPLDQLLGLATPFVGEPARLIISLSAVRGNSKALPEELIRFLQEICRLRSDWNGELLSLRNSDSIPLAAIANCSVENLPQWFRENELLLSK